MGKSVRTRVRGLAPLLLSALVWGCAPSSPPAASPADGPVAMEGPSGEAAAAALRSCGRLGTQRKQACYDEALLGTLRAHGVRPAMEALNAVVARDRDVARDAHVYAHGIGIAAFAGAERVGEIFSACTPEHQSGCYHGVVQAYFIDARRGGGELSAEAVNALCRDYRGEGQAWLQFQCAHGMGHGLVMFHGHDLPAALKGCDQLESGFERETCYQGAFMENVVNATMPHHPASELSQGGHGAHGGHADADAGAGHDAHAHHGAAAAPATPFKALDPDDLLYPCNAVEERYWSACYSMQTSAMLHFTRQDVGRTARECLRVPERMRSTCFLSLGRDISGMTVQDRAESRKRCAQVPDRADRAWCHVGAATNMLNVTSRVEDGIAYCRELPPTEDKARCYESVGGQLLVLASGDAAREEACRTAEPEHVDACRRGAGLAAAAR
jgi:hypothetical protein